MKKSSITRRRFLKGSAFAVSALAVPTKFLFAQAAQVDTHIEVILDEPIGTISAEIYSHSIEQFGGVIYDGVWVGEKSKIPNQGGIRTAFIEMMHALRSPVLRWPGGCFAALMTGRTASVRMASTTTMILQILIASSLSVRQSMRRVRGSLCTPFLQPA